MRHEEKFFAYLACLITYGLLCLFSIMVMVRTYMYGFTIFKRYVSNQRKTPHKQREEHQISPELSPLSSNHHPHTHPHPHIHHDQMPHIESSSVNDGGGDGNSNRIVYYETKNSSSFTDKKLIALLIMTASIFRFIQFILQSFVHHFQMYRSMDIVVSTLPAAMYISIELLLVFYWAEIVHQKRFEKSLKTVFVMVNLFMYAFLFVCDGFLIYQFFTVDRIQQNQHKEEEETPHEYTIYEIVCVVYSAVLFVVTAFAVALYGGLLIWKLARMTTSKSHLWKRTIRIVAVVSVISSLCLLSRCIVIIVQIFVKHMETKWYTIVGYYLLGEIVPLSLLIYVLNLMTKQQSSTIHRFQEHYHNHHYHHYRPYYTTSSNRQQGGDYLSINDQNGDYNDDDDDTEYSESDILSQSRDEQQKKKKKLKKNKEKQLLMKSKWSNNNNNSSKKNSRRNNRTAPGMDTRKKNSIRYWLPYSKMASSEGYPSSHCNNNNARHHQINNNNNHTFGGYPSLLRYSPQRHQFVSTDPSANIYYQSVGGVNGDVNSSFEDEERAALRRNDSQSSIQTFTDSNYGSDLDDEYQSSHQQQQ